MTDSIDADDGLISLREAINAANANQPLSDAPAGEVDGDRIVFAESLGAGSVELLLGELEITDDLVLRGSKVPSEFSTTSIDAGSMSRIFNINTPERVYMRSLVLDAGAADLGGHALIGEGSNVVFVDTRFHRASAISGGSLYVEDASLRLVETSFFDNEASGNGGAIHASGDSNVFIRVTNFGNPDGSFGNTADDSGGAIFVTDSAQLTTDASFFGNSATESGGAIESRALSKVNLFGNATLVGNSVSGENGTGGAISFRGETFHASEAVFSNNNADSGGAVAAFGSVSVLKDVSIETNTAENQGGGILLGGGSKMYLNGTTISGNTSERQGGGVSVRNASFVVTDSVIRENRSELAGGGIYSGGISDGSVSLRIVDSVIDSNNTARGDGGGVAILSNAISVIRSSTISNNSIESLVRGRGGGLSFTGFDSGSVLIFDSNISNNTATFGGGLSSTRGYMLVSGGSVNSNSADAGGGIYAQSQTAVVGTSIESNSARQGGGAYVADSGRLISRADTVFESNTASFGGALFANRGFAQIEQSQFVGNEAFAGGAVQAGFAGQVFIRTSNFSNNLARDNGSAINVEPGGLAVAEDSEFRANSVTNTEGDKGVVRVKRQGYFGNHDNLFAENSPGEDVFRE